MPWMIALVLLLGGVLFAGLAVRARAQEGAGVVTAERISQASNAEIEGMLARIETQPAPMEKMGAMCYEMSMPAPVTEYVCPVCGEKTLYPLAKGDWAMPLNGLEGLRQMQAEAQAQAEKRGVSVTLDESAFCRNCMPQAPEGDPEAVLVVRLPDGKVVRSENISSYDLRILRDFLAGSDVLKGSHDEEIPLKDLLPKLNALLGMAE